MPGNRRVTFDLPPRQSPPAPGGNNSLVLLPSPQLSTDGLVNQISTLRAELRDGRILQARQCNQLNQEATRMAELTRKYKDVKQERQELKTKLGYERDAAAAIQKRFNVAVKNHAEAQDKCARTMVECERLRILNEQLSLLNKGLGVSKSEAKADFEEKIAEIEAAFQDKVEEVEAAFVRELEETQEKLTNERIEQMEALKKELDNRDAKIKRLERDLNRQCEINAMFTLDYDRDTNFTKHLSMPLTIPACGATVNEFTSGLLATTKPRPLSPRRPLIHIESNNVTTRKRARVSSWRIDKEANQPSPKTSAITNSPGHDDQGRTHKRARSNHSSATASRGQSLPHSQSPFRSRLESGRRY
ncbi:unnamed protein product [Rhizoctonia solani]|uniref:Uncharacterized protein n=1 Tax=Rhizoctonia solani TaxID=456999 RepID=A0A8H2XHJ5_9AGAM|nr:unnamed protein product [Rhizoctonia solani]